MAKRKRETATVKMTYSEDTDLIAWWNSIPRGSRNAVMKDMMRDYIARERGGYRPILPRNVPQTFDPARFTQICDDTTWIRAALMDLPGYVEQVIQHVTQYATQHAAVVTPGDGTAVMNSSPHSSQVSDAAARRREQRMKKAQW